ncbi:hypothetical protein HK101_003554 [Irineochytrium annulatum]|nr:hypothetical protein HK101_003554 [Irineochytrium annulatum]
MRGGEKVMRGMDGNEEEEEMEELISRVGRVLVKWRGLAYEGCTWEEMPEDYDEEDKDGEVVLKVGNEEDEKFAISQEKAMRPSFVEGLRRYVVRDKVARQSLKPNKAMTRPRFKELEEQPEFVKIGTLKGYQMEGLNWLLYKWTKRVPCILADEMGLGKTVQIVSFINCLYKMYAVFPFLIVAPIITLGHWISEFAKWAPDLIVVHYGGNKVDRDHIRDHMLFGDGDGGAKKGAHVRFHVMLAGYDTMMSEAALFRGVPFRALICDEGHRLKNEEAKTFRSFVSNVDADHKIIMTGTPLQNNLRELFNLLNFLDPKNWADPKELELQYENISDEKIIKIHEDLKPYFLRRTKAQAEILVPCSLTKLQKEMYRAILSKNFKVLKTIGGKESNEGRTTPLHNILMQLRKVCDHPYLHADVGPVNLSAEQTHAFLTNACGKLILLQPLLARLKEKGHRVLIFSQFKIALNIIEDFLVGEKHKFIRIDGDTKMSERQGLLNAYNAPGSDHFIFLLTTRTGGVGINLTTADTIIMYDADWNPHQDIQAMARVHRIGQTKPVLIYKLFTRGAVEERIIEIGKRKLVLDHLVVEKMVEETVDSKEISEIIKFGAESIFNTDDASAAAEGGQDVKYDEAEIEKLLARDEIIAEQMHKEKLERGENIAEEGGIEGGEAAGVAGKAGVKNSFAFAKVWTLDKEEALPSADHVAALLEDVAAESRQHAKGDLGPRVASAASTNEVEIAEPDADTEFWDRVLKDRIEEAAREEERLLAQHNGKRVRASRKVVDYSEAKRQTNPRRRETEAEAASDEEDGEYDHDDASDSESGGSDGAPEGDEMVDKAPVPIVAPVQQPGKQQRKRKRRVVELHEFKVPDNPNVDPDDIDVTSSLACFLCKQRTCRYRSQCVDGMDTRALLRAQSFTRQCVGMETGNPIYRARSVVLARLLRRNGIRMKKQPGLAASSFFKPVATATATRLVPPTTNLSDGYSWGHQNGQGPSISNDQGDSPSDRSSSRPPQPALSLKDAVFRFYTVIPQIQERAKQERLREEAELAKAERERAKKEAERVKGATITIATGGNETGGGGGAAAGGGAAGEATSEEVGKQGMTAVDVNALKVVAAFQKAARSMRDRLTGAPSHQSETGAANNLIESNGGNVGSVQRGSGSTAAGATAQTGAYLDPTEPVCLYCSTPSNEHPSVDCPKLRTDPKACLRCLEEMEGTHRVSTERAHFLKAYAEFFKDILAKSDG